MKKLIRNWGFCLFAIVAAGIFKPVPLQAQVRMGVSIQAFYDNLQPYGRWVNHARYGKVWIPDAEPGFQPYATRGHWVQTSYGNTWVSDYPWGWATFHYGRWHYDDYYGWEWVPDDEWGPAWVNWRSGGGYYGWTPLEPGIDINININIPFSRWVFVPDRYICHPQVYNYYEPRPRAVNIIRNTTVINNIYVYNNHRYVSGPRRGDIERVTNQRVRVYNISSSDRPGRESIDNGNIRVYRPEADRRNAGRYDGRTAEGRYGQSRQGAYDRQDNTADNRNDGWQKPGRDNSWNRGNNNPDVNTSGSQVNDNRPQRPERGYDNNRSADQQRDRAPAWQNRNRTADGQERDRTRADAEQRRQSQQQSQEQSQRAQQYQEQQAARERQGQAQRAEAQRQQPSGQGSQGSRQQGERERGEGRGRPSRTGA